MLRFSPEIFTEGNEGNKASSTLQLLRSCFPSVKHPLPETAHSHVATAIFYLKTESS
jgi:hypothetical protein